MVGGWITEAQSETELGQDARSDSMKWMLDLSTRGYRYVLEVEVKVKEEEQDRPSIPSVLCNMQKKSN